jgi:hypothetical protein
VLCRRHGTDIAALLVDTFLDHLERDRGNSPRTRNTPRVPHLPACPA